MDPIVYIADISKADKKAYEFFYGAVPECRKKKADALRNGHDRLLSVSSFALLMKALADAGVSLKGLELGESGKGKPYIKGNDHPCFSLSHSGSYVMCSLADVRTGCDTETVRKGRCKIADRFFSGEEIEYIRQFTYETERDLSFTRIWTLKESYVKTLGSGFSTPFQSFSAVTSQKRTVIRPKTGGTYSLFEYRTGTDQCFSSCFEGDIIREPKIVVTDASEVCGELIV